jgi:parallel beta-helix repeat protein
MTTNGKAAAWAWGVLGLSVALASCGNPGPSQSGAEQSALPADSSSPAPSSGTVLPETVQPEALGAGGLSAEYFDRPNFTNSRVKRTEQTVNVDWKVGSPDPSIAPNTFSARYTGGLSAPVSGTYTFYATADDGVRLSLSGQNVVNDFSDHAVRTATGTFSLKAGQPVPLQLEYYENTGLASLKLEWSGPGVARQIIPAAALSTSVTPALAGQTFYVAPTGNDSGPGSADQPWKTVYKATEALMPGQTVLIRDGTYGGGLNLKRSGEPGKPISFRAAPGAKPVLISSQKGQGGVSFEGASYINLSGLDFEYTAPGAEQAKGEQADDGIAIFDGPGPKLPHHINISGNTVHNFPGGGISTGLADYVTIEGNTVWENARWSKYDNSGISLYQNKNFDLAPGIHNIVRGNTVFANENRVPGGGIGSTTITDGNCIIIDDSRQTQKFLADKTQYPAYVSTTLVENNICSGNGGRGVHVYSSDHVLARHNTLFRNAFTLGIDGELTAVDASDVRFVNNVVYAAAGEPATVTYNTQGVVFENNLYFGTVNMANRSASDRVGDPLFENGSTDLKTANFRLKAGSPAIDTALPSQSPATDVGGQPRPKGVRPDLGAWESR